MIKTTKQSKTIYVPKVTNITKLKAYSFKPFSRKNKNKTFTKTNNSVII